MASIKLKGDTSGEITIQAPSVAGTNTLNLQASSGTLATTAQASVGTKNLIINGDMRIAQRSASVAGLGNGDSGYHTCDRWRFSEEGSPTFEFTQSQSTDVPTGQGFAKSLKMDCTTAQTSLGTQNNLYLNQRFEGQNLQYLKKGTANAESTTLSFWVKSNKTGTYTVVLWDSDNSRNISKSYTIDSASTWEKKTITFAGDTSGALNNDNGRSLDLYFNLTLGSNYTSGTLATSWQSYVASDWGAGQTVNLADSTANEWLITGVQLEVGTEATPFENRMYSTELAMCQRYYQTISKIMGYTGPSTTSIQCSIPFPITMRATPNFSQSGVFRFDDAAAGYTQTSTGFVLASSNNTGTVATFQNFTVGGTFRPHGKANTATFILEAEL